MKNTKFACDAIIYLIMWFGKKKEEDSLEDLQERLKKVLNAEKVTFVNADDPKINITTNVNDLPMNEPYVMPSIPHVSKESLPFCPNCGSELKKAPKSKTRCKECNEFIYVRRRNMLYDRAQLTWDEVVNADFWEELVYQGANDELLNETKANLSEKFEQNENDLNMGDVLWSINMQLPMKHKDDIQQFLRVKSNLDYASARFMARCGKNPTMYLRSYFNNRIEEEVQTHKLYGYPEKLLLYISMYCCQSCKDAIPYKKYTPDELRDKLPPKTCSHIIEDVSIQYAFCTCAITRL